jgi:deazaflavin-dependent oxidoreductase (nitroreductase family)
MNPFAGTRGYARVSNLLMAPLFRLAPIPAGFALLTVTGRKSGRPYLRPVRAVRSGGTLYVVAMMGERSDWLRNVQKTPRVSVKLGRTVRNGLARELTDSSERKAAFELYERQVFPFDYSGYLAYEWSWPTRPKIQGAHRRWAADGALVAIDLEGAA